MLQSEYRNIICGECAAKRKEEEKRKKEEEERLRVQRVIERWIPPLFRDSDPSQINRKVLKCVERFNITGERGLYLHGQTDKCKTRGACLILKAGAQMGYSIAMVESTELAELVIAQFRPDTRGDSMLRSNDEQQRVIERLKAFRSAQFLLVDDIGKARATERYEQEVYSILNHRMNHRKPTLYTSNFAPRQLMEKFSEDGWQPIIRRIVDFCEVVEI